MHAICKSKKSLSARGSTTFALCVKLWNIFSFQSIDLSIKIELKNYPTRHCENRLSSAHSHSLLVVRVLHDKNIIYNFNCEKGQNTVYINTMKRIERSEDNNSKKSAKRNSLKHTLAHFAAREWVSEENNYVNFYF